MCIHGEIAQKTFYLIFGVCVLLVCVCYLFLCMRKRSALVATRSRYALVRGELMRALAPKSGERMRERIACSLDGIFE